MNGQAFLARARRAARPAAARRRVEGPAPVGRRRSRARRSPRRPRVPRQLQVPLAHRRERVARAPLRPAAQRRARATQRRQLVPRDRAATSTPRSTRRSATRSTIALPADVDRRSTPSNAARSRTRSNAAARGRATATRCYAALVERVATESARRWRAAIDYEGRVDAVAAAPHRERALLRARRVAEGFTRFRIATPWDWRQHFELRHVRRRGPRRRAADGRVGRDRAAARRRRRRSRVRRTRRDPLEPRPLLRTARGEGVPRHPARTKCPATSRSTDGRVSAWHCSPRGDERRQRRVDPREELVDRVPGSPSSSQCNSASNTNDTSVSAAHRVRTRAGACATPHELLGVGDHLLAELVGVRRELRLAAPRAATAT